VSGQFAESDASRFFDEDHPRVKCDCWQAVKRVEALCDEVEANANHHWSRGPSGEPSIAVVSTAAVRSALVENNLRLGAERDRMQTMTAALADEWEQMADATTVHGLRDAFRACATDLRSALTRVTPPAKPAPAAPESQPVEAS